MIEGPLEPGEPSRVACFHFKVADYEGAKAEMEQKRLPLLTDITPRRVRGGAIGLYRTFLDIGGFGAPCSSC